MAVAAKKLFAALGYDQTTNEMIARSAGMPVSFVADECGGKERIYRDIFRSLGRHRDTMMRLFEQETSPRDRFYQIIDELFRYFAQDYEGAAIWRQRSIGDAADLQNIEGDYADAPFRQLVRLTEDVFRADVDTELMILTIISSIHSFFHEAPFGSGEEVPDDRMIERFRRHIFSLVDPFLS